MPVLYQTNSTPSPIPNGESIFTVESVDPLNGTMQVEGETYDCGKRVAKALVSCTFPIVLKFTKSLIEGSKQPEYKVETVD